MLSLVLGEGRSPKRWQHTEDGLDRAMSTARAKSPVLSIALLSIAVTFCVSSLGIVVFVYLFAIHTTWIEGAILVSTARLQLVTAITQALSTCIARVIPIIVSIYAYSTAAEWLTLSELADGDERPTALQ